MIRQTLDADSAYINFSVTPSNGITLKRRRTVVSDVPLIVAVVTGMTASGEPSRPPILQTPLAFRRVKMGSAIAIAVVMTVLMAGC